MTHTRRPILEWARLALAAVTATLGACSARAPTVPTAIIYNRDAETWRVETQPVQGEPDYPQTLPIFTEAAGERREGLFPPAKFRTREHGYIRWKGPSSVRHEESFWRDNPWRVKRYRMMLPVAEDLDQPLELSTTFRGEYPDPWPHYSIRTNGVGMSR